MDNYTIPETLEDMKHGDRYQIKYPIHPVHWGAERIYSSNICESKKEEIRSLIREKRIRIIK